MFEAVELGRTVSKEDWKKQEPELRTQLLQAQWALEEHNIPLIIVVSGVEGAGKGYVVDRLTEWMDSRGVRVHAFWDETDEQRERPRIWRFSQATPPRGKIAMMFGSWYTKPIVDSVFEDMDDAALERSMKRLVEFETMLTLDGMLIVKLWFHLSKKSQQKRFKQFEKKGGRKLRPEELRYAEHYDEFARVSERAIRLSDTGICPWYLIESEDKRYRDLTVGRTIVQAIEERLEQIKQGSLNHHVGTDHKALPPESESATVTILDHLDVSQMLDAKEYDEELDKYQRKLNQLSWKAWKQKRSVVAVFEGWDAGGKGGAIRRATGAMDARLYRVISTAAPTDEEKAHHYLWRFWRHLPRDGYMTFYDRSWYGRVLVERVEGFADESEWMRSYKEINDFEEHLAEHGVVVLKFWLHISNEEQLRRFKEREKVPWKQWKITDEDWRNREKWDDYKAAVNDMVTRTSTSFAPWTLVPANDKRFARIEVLKTLCDRLEEALD